MGSTRWVTMMASRKNAEGYYDPTAYQAIKNIEKEGRRMREMSIKRGDVYYIESYYQTGSEQKAGRPAIIISNDKNNEFAGTVEVVYLTTQPKRYLPTHVTIRSVSRESTALCEQITTVSTERIRNYMGHITEDEMESIETAILISLAIPANEKCYIHGKEQLAAVAR